MKSKYHTFVPFISMIAYAAWLPLQAAVIDTTGNTAGTPEILAANNTYIGDGFLSAQNISDLVLIWGSDFAMTGGVFTIESGVEVTSDWGTNWTNNKADIQVDGTFDISGNPPYQARVDALNGAGIIKFQNGSGEWRNAQILHVGLDDGSGTFSGTVEGLHSSGTGINIIKSGTGTQTFNNLANQPMRTILVNAGSVDLSTPTAATLGTAISGAGDIIKSGVGVLTLTNSLSNTGITTVSEGTLSIASGLTGNSKFVVTTGAVLDLNFAGTITVAGLDVGGSGPLPPDFYNSSHPTYGAFFTGTGTLRIQPTITNSDGAWTSLAAGNWSDSANWAGNLVASGSSQTATFQAATGVAVSLNADFTLGHLIFGTNGYSLTGPGLIILADPTAPTVTVNSGIQSRIEATIQGTSGFVKEGSGTLTLSGGNTNTGSTLVNAGRLVFENVVAGSASYTVGTASFLEFAVNSGQPRQIANGAISGGGNLVKSGAGVLMFGANGQTQTFSLTSGALIDVQGGALRNEYGNSGWGTNLADVNVATGAFFDIWDGSTTVDALTGSGTINKGWSATNSLTFGADNGSGTFSGPISQGPQAYGGEIGGNFSLIKTGTGTQTLTGANTYNGATTVSVGTLALVGGSQASPVTVSTGASLGFTLGSPTTSTSSFDLTAGTIKITGTPTLASYTLIAASSGISGTPVLHAPIAGYALEVDGNSLKLVQTGGSGYSSWAATNAPTGTSGQDFDGDGVTNGIEYVLGGTKDTKDLGKLPQISSSGANIVVTFNRDQASINGTTTVAIQVGTDLVTWPASYSVPGPAQANNPGVTVAKDTSPGFDTITLTIPRNPDPKKFARLDVTTN